MRRASRTARRIGAAVLALAPGVWACADESADPTGPVPGLPPTVIGVEPAVVEVGGSATLRGLNFAARPSSNRVEFGELTASVTSASKTSLGIQLPSPRDLPCRPTRPAPLRVSVAGRSHTVQHPFSVAPGISLEPGESRALLDPDARIGCREFPAADAEFLVSIFNTARVPTAEVSFEFRGQTGVGGREAAGAVTERSAEGRAEAGPSRVPAALRRVLRAGGRHRGVLERNRRLVERARASGGGLGLSASRGRAPSRDRITADRARGQVQAGDHVQLRVPDLNQSGSICENFIEVTARVAHVTEHAVLVSDTSNPIDSDYDDRLREMGSEFEDRMWPLVRENFGDPLRLDDQLNDDGRLYMLFTPEVNDFGGILAFVFTGDFFPRESDDPDKLTCAASDTAEVFYARAPTRVAPDDFGSITATAGWQRVLRSTIIHEVKHLTANAERLSRGLPLETTWLEESTAHMAEELYAREVFGFSQGSNTTYEESLFCAVRPAGSDGCPTGSPFVMVSEFVWLAQYMQDTPSLSPIGAGGSSPVFRGSGWWLLRWAVDHAPTPEAEFLGSMTTSPRTGIRNLETQAGRSWSEILADWTLALAADDTPSGGIEREELTVPSWDVRDVYRGLHEDFCPDGDGGLFCEPYPLTTRSQSYGSFSHSVGGLPGGSTAIFRLLGRREVSQLVEIAGSGGELPPGVRVSAVRLP